MLLQTLEEKIVLVPSWPADWDADFKLHAPGQTTIEGKVRNGKIAGLTVDPEGRKADVVVLDRQLHN
jgi:hypothetical protein